MLPLDELSHPGCYDERTLVNDGTHKPRRIQFVHPPACEACVSHTAAHTENKFVGLDNWEVVQKTAIFKMAFWHGRSKAWHSTMHFLCVGVGALIGIATVIWHLYDTWSTTSSPSSAWIIELTLLCVSFFFLGIFGVFNKFDTLVHNVVPCMEAVFSRNSWCCKTQNDPQTISLPQAGTSLLPTTTSKGKPSQRDIMYGVSDPHDRMVQPFQLVCKIQ